MQRRLAAEDTQYSKVLAGVRFDVAKQMLQEGNKRVGDISALLGYSNPTHFSRAFRRIAGIAPQMYSEQFSSKMP